MIESAKIDGQESWAYSQDRHSPVEACVRNGWPVFIAAVLERLVAEPVVHKQREALYSAIFVGQNTQQYRIYGAQCVQIGCGCKGHDLSVSQRPVCDVHHSRGPDAFYIYFFSEVFCYRHYGRFFEGVGYTGGSYPAF